jgi:hypothetical protein
VRVGYWLNTIIFWIFITVGAATIFEVLNELWKMVKARGSKALAF